jgi:hypothetical protein
MQYGSFGDGAMNGDVDTNEAQRENEALQRVVAKTSKLVPVSILHATGTSANNCSNMVDIFEIAPQDPASRGTSTPFAYTGQGARVARYQHLVSKLNTEDDESLAGVKVDWLGEDDTVELQRNQPASIKTINSDDAPLVGTFADAAAAMK